jgi:hypothetical protein
MRKRLATTAGVLVSRVLLVATAGCQSAAERFADTANFRNPNYHRATDTIDTLDFGFMRGAVRATIAGLVALATVDADGNGQPDICA